MLFTKNRWKQIQRKTALFCQSPTFYLKAWWAWIPILQRFVIRHSKLGKPILVISLPRSGSNWMLSILGAEKSTLPLFEPVLTRLIDRGDVSPWFKTHFADPAFREASDRAFAAVPCLPSQYVAHHHRWGICWRSGKRVVVKEVLVRNCRYFIEKYKPQVVFLRRHPAAVAESMLRTDVMNHGLLDLVVQEADLRDLVSPDRFFYSLGRLQGYLLSELRSVLANYTDVIEISHEDACSDPVCTFQGIYSHCGLQWSSMVEQAIAKYWTDNTLAHKNKAFYFEPVRFTQGICGRMHADLTEGDLNEVRMGWMEYDLPWYQSDDAWGAEG